MGTSFVKNSFFWKDTLNHWSYLCFCFRVGISFSIRNQAFSFPQLNHSMWTVTWKAGTYFKKWFPFPAISVSNGIRISLTLSFADITSKNNFSVFLLGLLPYPVLKFLISAFRNGLFSCGINSVPEDTGQSQYSVRFFKKHYFSGGLTPYLLHGQKFFLMNQSFHNDQPSSSIERFDWSLSVLVSLNKLTSTLVTPSLKDRFVFELKEQLAGLYVNKYSPYNMLRLSLAILKQFLFCTFLVFTTKTCAVYYEFYPLPPGRFSFNSAENGSTSYIGNASYSFKNFWYPSSIDCQITLQVLHCNSFNHWPLGYLSLLWFLILSI